MSACLDSQSTILPLPSSPHWEPTTTTLAMRHLSSAWPRPGYYRSYNGLPQNSALNAISDAVPPSKPATARRKRSQRDKSLILRVSSTHYRRPSRTTLDDLALSKAILRQHRGGSGVGSQDSRQSAPSRERSKVKNPSAFCGRSSTAG